MVKASASKQWDGRIGRRLKLHDLHILQSAVQSGSMTRAAAQLAISTPAISKAISDLEFALGVRLVDRGSRGIEPTTYGAAVLKRAEIAFDELKQAIRDIEFLANPDFGEVRIGSPELIRTSIIPPFLEALHHRHPGIVPVIEEIATPTLDLSELRARKVDLVLVRLLRPIIEGQSLADLNVEVLFEDRNLVTVGTKSRWARRRKVDLSELVGEPWVLAEPNTWDSRIVAEAFRSRALSQSRIAAMTLSPYVRASLAASGRYITIIPYSVVNVYAARFSLKTLPIELHAPPWPVAVVTLKNRTPSPIVEIFLKALRLFSQPLRASTLP